MLEGYAALVAQRAGDEGRDASRLLSTLRVLAVLEGRAVPDQRIWEAADINRATWKAYEDLLQRTYLSGAIRTADGLYALEVKASPSIGPADAEHLRWLRDKMGDRLITGYLLHAGADTDPVDDTIWAVPITDLC